MTRPTPDATVKFLGLALGLTVAIVLLAVSRVPAATGSLGADVTVVATPPGELVVSQSGAFVRARALEAGGQAAAGRLGIRNITERAMAVRVRLLPSSPDLDAAVRVELEDAGTPVAVGSLRELRRWSGRGLSIEPGGERRLDGRVLVRPGAAGYEGRSADVTLELRARPVRRSR